MVKVTLIYASTSGHTEYVATKVTEVLSGAKIETNLLRAERAKPEDLTSTDVLVLASSTWNTGNVEGQLNPHMWALLLERAKEVDLGGKTVACIALGDQRYRYTANASKHLEDYVSSHKGSLLMPTLKVVNEPYDQEPLISDWSNKLLSQLATRNP